MNCKRRVALHSTIRGVKEHMPSCSQVHYDALSSADESGRKLVQITGASRPGKETGARLCCICFFFIIIVY